MTAYALLALAIVTEVAATACLRMATRAGRSWYLGVVVGYVAAFALLSLVLSAGVPLGVAYGTWTAAGVALTAVVGRVVFGEAFTRATAAGTALIVVGVLLVELGAAR